MDYFLINYNILCELLVLNKKLKCRFIMKLKTVNIPS